MGINKTVPLLRGGSRIFKKRGCPRTDRTLAPVGTGGVWGGYAPSEAEKNCNFQSQFARFGAFFLPGVSTQSQVPYLCKNRGGAHWVHPPSKSLPAFAHTNLRWLCSLAPRPKRLKYLLSFKPMKLLNKMTYFYELKFLQKRKLSQLQIC